ncbi:MAG: T9SS type A sorting domain-containing protein [Saprospiraceae bacterium]|nr:T9SS type A sorting domain-containing protein [Saprospiraceae bacterium]MBK6817004.1 T9SS type A sorting domain-containing protein [Saprospiraceae bacterium]MBK7371534.1 T9SS type A sorting domain-containing protein [Saprospiraceae bacterium]MBK7435969.1 T9SS type A sorting domain-containing protein [Saprospiraceae bacterium]MBK7606613.1 T9SS type A sorting domain-containing protein [Saprospiraceae bacterium]
MKYIFIISFFFVSMSVNAQTMLTLEPNPVSMVVKSNDLDVAGKASLKNNSKDTLIVKWSRKIENITQGWSSAVCDKNFCYIPTIDTMKLVLAPGEISNMDIHVYPMGISGSAKVTLRIEQVGSPDNFVSGAYFFNQTTPLKSDVEKDAIQLYPNPAQEYFMVTSPVVLGKIELYNITGDKAKVYYAYKNKRYYIDDVPSGIYMVRLLNLQQEIVKTVVLKKK